VGFGPGVVPLAWFSINRLFGAKSVALASGGRIGVQIGYFLRDRAVLNQVGAFGTENPPVVRPCIILTALQKSNKKFVAKSVRDG
jgi:hypothetical protein